MWTIISGIRADTIWVVVTLARPLMRRCLPWTSLELLACTARPGDRSSNITSGQKTAGGDHGSEAPAVGGSLFVLPELGVFLFGG
jgi:hypothetical protein